MMRGYLAGVGLILAIVAAGSGEARWTEMAAGRRAVIAKAGLSVVPPAHWNQSSTRLSNRSESWSFDGPLLNRIDFFGVPTGEPLAKERNRKREPLPKFTASMQSSDVAEFYERTSRIVEGTSDFAIDTVAPVTFAGRKGFRFSFHYTGGDDTLVRKGLATGAVIGGKLYLITYTAPGLHYYDAGLADAQAIMESAAVG